MRMSVELELRELFLATARSLLIGSFRSAVQPLLNLPAGPLHNQTAFFLLMLCYLKEYLS